MLSKNTCEGVHLIVKLPAISLQACKFSKNELLPTYFLRILLDLKLLFIVHFLCIISLKDASRFNGGFVFQMERASFLSGGCTPWGTSVLMGGGGGLLKKVMGWGWGVSPPPPMSPPSMGSPAHRS